MPGMSSVSAVEHSSHVAILIRAAWLLCLLIEVRAVGHQTLLCTSSLLYCVLWSQVVLEYGRSTEDGSLHLHGSAESSAMMQ